MAIVHRNVRVFSPAVLIGGGLAGFFAGILFGVAQSLAANSAGMGISTPMQDVAATFYGPMAFVGGAGVTAIGVVTHLVISTLYGILFAALTIKIGNIGINVLLGIAYSIGIWAFMTYVITPVFDATLSERLFPVATWWFFTHWIYGGFLGLFTPLRNAFAGSGVSGRTTYRDDRLAA